MTINDSVDKMYTNVHGTEENCS